MTSMPADREAFYQMTKLKLDRFKRRKLTFDQIYEEIIKQVKQENISPAEQVDILHKGVEELFEHNDQNRYLANFDDLTTISKLNTSTSDNLLKSFCQQLRKIIEGGKRRSEYNYLFGLIMSQWFSEQKNPIESTEDQSESEITSKDYILTNERLEQIIFDEPNLDYDQWRDFLENKLFGRLADNPKHKNVFADFRQSMQDYSETLLRDTVSNIDVKQTICSLLSNNLLDDHRKRLMEKLSNDENAVIELASSLTLLKSDLDKWNWPSEGVRGVFRRNLQGRYRCYYEEDFLTAIFLQYIGLKWTFHFKFQLKRLFVILTENLIKNQCAAKSIEYNRIEMQRNDFWMASFPDQQDVTNVYEESNSFTNTVNLKTKLLYLINTEIQLHQTIHPSDPFTVMCADFEWFGPSVAHKTIRIFLDVCGVSNIWLDFFDRFLKQPVFYKPNKPIRERKRGVPVSHSLSFLLSDLLIFGMDLYVYQSTGIFNYRLHDDFWFFDADQSRIEQTWTLMNEFANLIGLKFNSEKCGSVQILPSGVQPMTTSLPNKDVKWGLLKLESNGRFDIDRNALTPYLDEFKGRLTKSKTILEWVKLYNEYIAFFMRNFGKSSYTLGKFHMEKTIETFQFIHRYVFDQSDGNAWTVLTDRIREQFPNCINNDILEGWIYWPLIQGGLGLRNIYIELHGFHQTLQQNTRTQFANLIETDKRIYQDLEERYEQWQQTSRYKQFSVGLPYAFIDLYVEQNSKFPSYDEFIAERENQLLHWSDVYTSMLYSTIPTSPQNIHTLRSKTYSHSRGQQSQQVDYYLDWLTCYYGEQIESTFQQVDFIDSDSIPIGLIKIMKTSAINWDQEENNNQ